MEDKLMESIEPYQFADTVPYLSAGAYETAFSTYAGICDTFLTMAKNGDPFDADDLPKLPFPALRNLIICLVIGMITGGIAVGK